MTRHAKKTHAQLFDAVGGGGTHEQQQHHHRHRRLSSTPALHHTSCGGGGTSSSTTADPLLLLLRGGGGGCGLPSSRKERSVSDPGPNALLPLGAGTPVGDMTIAASLFNASSLQRPLVSPTGVLSDFQKLGTDDSLAVVGAVYPSSSGRLPFGAGDNFPEQRSLAAFGAAMNAASGDDIPSDTPSLSAPVRETSITTPVAGSDDDDGSMTAIVENLTSSTPPSSGHLFEDYDLKEAASEMPPLMVLAVAEPQQQLTTLGGGIIKQEEEQNDDLFPSPEDSNSTTDEAAMRELLDEKDRMDIASFISEYNEEMYAQNNKCNNNSMDTENEEMQKIFIRVKEEPLATTSSRPSTPESMATFVGGGTAELSEEAAFDDDDDLDLPPPPQQTAEEVLATAAVVNPGPCRGVVVVQPSTTTPTGYICTATVLTQQPPPPPAAGAPSVAVVPRPVFIRTQSQDSLTRTKNPVLPSIHAELLPLVVPEPRLARYQNQPSAETPFTLEDFEAEAEVTQPPQQLQQQQLTELKGSLFLSDDYNQAYFQPWN